MSELCVHCGQLWQAHLGRTDDYFNACPLPNDGGWHPTNRFTPAKTDRQRAEEVAWSIVEGWADSYGLMSINDEHAVELRDAITDALLRFLEEGDERDALKAENAALHRELRELKVFKLE